MITSLRLRVAVFATLIAVVPLAALAFVAISQVRDAQIGSARIALRQAAGSTAGQLQRMVTDRLNEITAIAQLPTVTRALTSRTRIPPVQLAHLAKLFPFAQGTLHARAAADSAAQALESIHGVVGEVSASAHSAAGAAAEQQQRTDRMLAAVKGIGDRAEHVALAAAQQREGVRRIREDYAAIGGLMVEVEQSAIAQSSAVQEVTQAMRTVAHGSAAALETIERVEGVAADLREHSRDLARLIAGFRAGDDLPRISVSAPVLSSPSLQSRSRNEIRDEDEEHEQSSGRIRELV